MHNKIYKVAFIGGNINSAIGRTHKIACQMDGKFELVAGAFSRHKEINEKTAIEYDIPIEHVYDDYKELLKKEKKHVDVIIVLVSTDFHEQVVTDCLNSGYKVICEKSLSTSLVSGERIVNCMKKNQSFLGLIYNYTGYPMLRVLKAQENSFGFFKGLIDDVSCLIEYTNDMKVSIWYSKSALGNRNGLRIRLFGEKASAQWYQMEPEILKIYKNDGSQMTYDRSNDTLGLSERYNRFKAGHPIGFIEAFANYYDDLYEAIENFEQGKNFNTKYILPIEKSLEGLKLFELAHKSAKEEKIMKIIFSDNI